jgi:hypothetical protein
MYSMGAPTSMSASAVNKTPEELRLRVSPRFPIGDVPHRINWKGSFNSKRLDLRCSVI